MKNRLKHFSILFLLTMLVSTSIQAQTSKEILREYKKNAKTHMFTIPGFIAKIALDLSDTDKEIKQSLKKVKSVRVFISEGVDNKKYKSIVSDLNVMFKKNDYKPLVEVKNDGDVVQIQFLPGTKKKRGEFVVLAKSENDFVAVMIEGKFTEKDVRDLAKLIDIDDL